MDTHLQAKALTVSVDSSMFSLTKSNHLTRTTIAPKLEKDSTKARKEASKEKLKKELDNKKFHGVKVNEKKKETREELDVKRLSEKLKDVEMKDLQDCRESKRVSVSLAVRGGRRRSFCDSQVDLADVLASNGVKVVSADMPPFMQIHAVDCARKAYDSMEKFTSKTLALTLKKEFDGVYGPAWHCIVGTSFGSFVTHSVGGFMYFAMDQKLYILLFKTTVQRAD
nr:dynein light chain, cytoplasmic [Quercus suber]